MYIFVCFATVLFSLSHSASLKMDFIKMLFSSFHPPSFINLHINSKTKTLLIS